MGRLHKIRLKADHTASEFFFQPMSGQFLGLTELSPSSWNQSHQEMPKNTGNTENVTSLPHTAFQTLLNWLSDALDKFGCTLLGTSWVTCAALTGCVGVFDGSILLKIVHSDLDSALKGSILSFRLMHEMSWDLLNGLVL